MTTESNKTKPKERKPCAHASGKIDAENSNELLIFDARSFDVGSPVIYPKAKCATANSLFTKTVASEQNINSDSAK